MDLEYSFLTGLTLYIYLPAKPFLLTSLYSSFTPSLTYKAPLLPYRSPLLYYKASLFLYSCLGKIYIFIFIKSPLNFLRLRRLYPRRRRCYLTRLTNWAFNWGDESQYTDYQMPLAY